MDFDLQRDIEILERTPVVVRALLSGLSDEWTLAYYGPDTWSARDIVAHYIDGERTDWIPRARWILEHGTSRPFAPYDRQGLRNLDGHSLPDLLNIFERERAANIEALRSLPIDEQKLNSQGTHPALGTVTLRELLSAWAVHDLHHIGHICKAMAHQHRTEAGPWKAYLSILDPPAPR